MFKILGHDWEVKITPEAIGGTSGGRAFLGQGDEAYNQIFIDGTMPKSRQEEVFLHEIIHQVAHGMPEFAVNDVGIGLYAALLGNGLIPEDFLSRFSDGEATPAEMARLNADNEKMIEEPAMMFLRVSEKEWPGTPVMDAGTLTVTDQQGQVNRNAVHMAAADLIANRHQMSAGKQRKLAREIDQLYRDVLKETVPRRIHELSR